MPLKVALAGNPNVGKSTLFNGLTGLNQHVGNWPGKTVEKKEGMFSFRGTEIELVDLPGTYSLTAGSPEEEVVVDYFLEEEPDLVVNVVDASNLDRNLYLALQVMEFGLNTIIAVNLNREAEKEGYRVNHEGLSELLGVPVVQIEAVDPEQDQLLETVLRQTGKRPEPVTYEFMKRDDVRALMELIGEKIRGPSPGWVLIKLLEGDERVESMLDSEILDEFKKIRKTLEDEYGDTETLVADARYGLIEALIEGSVKRPALDRVTRSEIIDRVMLNRYLGLPILLGVMWLVFQLTFTAGAPITELIEGGFSVLAESVSSWSGSSLLADGIIGGVGAVMVFIPNIFILFFLLSFLEDSGYLARAAFVMDRIMNTLGGLSGRSFIPMMLGFGCCVPAIMSTRTIDSERDRILTSLIVPFMSCSARLPVYVLFTAALFPFIYRGWVIFSLYILGIAVAIISARLLGDRLLGGERSLFLMELPPYRMPRLRTLLIHTWMRGVQFVKKAGTVILAGSLVIWFLSNYPGAGVSDSFLGMLGAFIAPFFQQLGFGEWQSAVALIFGFVAKELVISTFGTVYGSGNIQAAIQGIFTPLEALSFMVFVLLYTPCIATLGVIKQEAGSRWALFSLAYSLATAWVVSFLVYTAGTLVGF